MKSFFTVAMLTLSTSVLAQASFITSTDTKNGSLVFDGRITFQDLNNEPSFTWMKEGYGRYKPKSRWVDELKNDLANTSMVIFMGTWCSDSHRLIPRLEKVLDAAGYSKSAITMYGVDRTKATRDGASEQYGITNVPTIILLRNGKEIGRITESADRSIEADLEDIAHP